MTGLLPRTPQDAPVRLSPRERQVAQLVAEGFEALEIAETFGLSVSTVETYVAKIARRLPGRTRPMRKIMRWWFLQRLAACSCGQSV